MARRLRVLVIGGGFAGLNTVRALKKTSVDVLLLDKANHHLFQPLLYQVASAALAPSNIASPLRHILSRQTNASVLLADIIRIDKDKKEVVSANKETFPYDYLILAPGARHSYFGHPEWESLAPGLKTLDDALKIRERILLSYERAERCLSIEESLRFMRFVIVGGGPTGVEMAGAIAEIAHQALVRDFSRIKPSQTEIYLVEGGDQLLSSYPADLAERAKKDLEKLGVQVLLNTLVTNITPTGVTLGQQFLETPNVIWAAGNQASPLLKTLCVPLDQMGRVIVQADLTVAGYPHIFVIGDAACCMGQKGEPLPGIAPVAIQQGRYVAQLIAKNQSASTQDRKPFVYRDKGMMATIGKEKAVGKMGKLEIFGFMAWLIWGVVHIFYLISFSNKLLVMFEWFYLYFCNQRRIRLITRPISDKDDPLFSSKIHFFS